MARRPFARRIAFLHPNLGYGGGERVLLEQIRALAPLDVTVDVFLTERPDLRGLEPEVREANPRVDRVEAGDSSRSLVRALVAGGHDLAVASIFPRGMRAVRRLRRFPWRRRPAALAVVHSRYPAGLAGIRRDADAADAVLLTHDFVEEAAAGLALPRDRFVVAEPLGPPFLLRADDDARARATALRAAWGVGPSGTVLGYAGRLFPEKGLPELIEAFRVLLARGNDVHLVLAGPLAERSDWVAPAFLDAFGAARGRVTAAGTEAERRLHVLSARPRDADLPLAFDVAVLPSQHEGLLPFALVEALSVGTPVVATAVGGIPSRLRDGIDAVLVGKVSDDGSPHAPDFPERLADAIEPLMRDASLRARLGAAGRARIESLAAAGDFPGAFLRACDLAFARRGCPPLPRPGLTRT